MKALEKNTHKEQSQKLIDSINNYTQIIINEYPELYQFLDESPLNTHITKDSLSINELKEYLKSLQAQLNSYKKTHNKKPSK